MAERWTTPKSSLPPHLRPSSRVTPTLALSEGPLSPSPIYRFRQTYKKDQAPKFNLHEESRSPEDKENEEEPNLEIIKLQCQVEQLTQLVQDRLSNDSQPKPSVTQLCDCHGIRNCSSLVLLHAECQERIQTLQNESSALNNIVQDTKERFEQLEKENRELKVQLDHERRELLSKISTIQQNLSYSETNVRELQRDNERLAKGKETLESYLKQLPSVDELETAKAEAKEKSESNRRMHAQIEKLNKKLNNAIQAREKAIQSDENTKKEIEDLKLKIEELEAENIAHQKRLQKSSTSNDVNIEGLLHDRDKLKKENDTIKHYILATTKKNSKEMDLKNNKIKELSEKSRVNDNMIDELKEELECQKDTNRHLREQVTDHISRQELLKKRIEELEIKLNSSENKNEISQDLQFLQTKTNSELLKCVNEMNQLMHVSKQMVNGEDPNVSMLLGVQSSTPVLQSNRSSMSSNMSKENICNAAKKSNSSEDQIKELKNILKSIDNIRGQVVELREHVSDRYAESIADNVSNCTTQ